MVKALCQRIRQGDAEAGEALLQMFEPTLQRMATAFAKRYVHLPLEIDDYAQEGRIALLRAAQQAHEQQLLHFTAYANTTVRNAMLDAVRVAYPDGSAVSLDTLYCTATFQEYALNIPAPFSLSPEQILLRKESIQELHTKKAYRNSIAPWKIFHYGKMFGFAIVLVLTMHHKRSVLPQNIFI